MDPAEISRFSRRTKTLEVEPLADGRIRFETSLVDQSFGGSYEDQGPGSAVLHHFTMTGTAAGDQLILETLEVRAEAHPFPQCPFILPATRNLIGLSLASGWRHDVLSRFRGSTGCTHVTTLLLGLVEVTTLAFFQRANELRPYGPKARASGEWIAGSLELGIPLAGACHVLDEGGTVIRRAQGQLDRARSEPDG
jgi:Protein of unknown function (DUF2889)